MANQLNILLIIPELGIGGAERAVSRLSVELSKIHKVYLCRFTDQDEIVYPFGGELLSLHEKSRTNLFTKAFGFFFRIAKLRTTKRRYRINISISYLEGANYANVLSSTRDRVIISQRGPITADKDIRGVVGLMRRRILIPLVYRRAHKVVALSEGLKRELMNDFGILEKKISVIYNHYDADELVRLTNQDLPPNFTALLGKPTLVTTGRLHQAKGHREFLDVFAQLKVDCDCCLIIFGDGVLRNELVAVANSLSLRVYAAWQDQELKQGYDVYLMGYVKDPFHLIAASTVFVFPSLYEGLGNSLVEALACRIPIVAADCHSGPREVLAPGTKVSQELKKAEFASYGVLMPILSNQNATAEWVAVLRKVITMPSLTDGYRAKGLHRLQEFGVNNVLNRWKSLLTHLQAE